MERLQADISEDVGAAERAILQPRHMEELIRPEDHMPELQACPFCGSLGVAVVGFGARCGTCGAVGPFGPTEEDAARRWNQRRTIPSVTEADGPADRTVDRGEGGHAVPSSAWHKARAALGRLAEETKMSKRTIGLAFNLVGVVIVFVALGADTLGLGGAPGLGWKQWAAALLGLLAAFVGIWLTWVGTKPSKA